MDRRRAGSPRASGKGKEDVVKARPLQFDGGDRQLPCVQAADSLGGRGWIGHRQADLAVGLVDARRSPAARSASTAAAAAAEVGAVGEANAEHVDSDRRLELGGRP